MLASLAAVVEGDGWGVGAAGWGKDVGGPAVAVSPDDVVLLTLADLPAIADEVAQARGQEVGDGQVNPSPVVGRVDVRGGVVLEELVSFDVGESRRGG